MNIRQSKNLLRATSRRRRAAIPPQVRDAAAQALAQLFNPHLRLKQNDVVAGYAATGSEIDCFPLLSAILEAGLNAGISCALPVVHDTAAPLRFYSWRPGNPLAVGPYGIMAPQDCTKPLTPTILLVPMLAFDGAGHRLGYGGGYYDRTIANLREGGRLQVIGVAFAAQRVDNLAAEPHDQRLDAVLTENGFYQFTNEGGLTV